MKKAINIFQYATMAIGFIVIVIFLIPRMFGIVPYVVLSGSMEPTIKTGAVAYVNTKNDVKDVVEGDIIAFNIESKQVTHRVVKINSDNSFTTKGDANNTVDLGKVKYTNYIGKTIFSIPYIGYILGYLHSSIGYFIISIVVILNIVLLIFSKEEEIINDAKNEESTKKSNNKKIIRIKKIKDSKNSKFTL